MSREEDIRTEYQRLTRALIEKGITISTMESATGGCIASLITDTEGSSAVFKGSLVTYCNEAKVKFGVPGEIIDKYSVYSVQTAEAMAMACRDNFGTDIGIGITGTCGNIDPNNAEASNIGTFYLGICLGKEVFTYEKSILPQATRHDYKLSVASELARILGEKISL